MTSLSVNGSSSVPPGFRFHPTEEELLHYYLKKKVSYEKIDLDVIRDVDLNKLEPWDLHERCKIGSAPQNEWYFFSHKDKKYPTGSRTNRATAAGFWKATGRDKAIRNSYKRIGMRKTLVFYKGRAPHGQKTDWIMHEYRLEDNDNSLHGHEDGWVVCRVFKKKNYLKGHDDNSDPGSSNLDQEHSAVLSEPKDSRGHGEVQYSQIQHQHHHHHQQQQLKHELAAAGMQYSILESHHHDQLMQMARHLENQKLMNAATCNTSPPVSSGIKRLFPERGIEDGSKRIHYSHELPTGHGNGNGNGSSHVDIISSSTQEHGHLNEIREGQVQLNDWSALDRLVASHLNQVEESSKEIRYVDAMPSGDHIPLPLRSEMDLWNFGK